MELALLSLLAIQCARLVWTAVTPVGPVGDWKASAAVRPPQPAATALLGSFDPFFRTTSEGTAPVVVTSLNLKLFGVREDRATGRGSAIIGTPDGQQRSFAVGEEVAPGVTLVSVGFDNVTISRGGTSEQMFLDQSQPAQTVGPAASAPMSSQPLPVITTPPPPPAVAPPPPAPGNSITNEIQFQPRINNGQLSGIAVQPQGSGNAFRAAGFAPGDVIMSVNGQPISSVEQARAIANQVGGGEANVVVNRGGRNVPLRVRAGQ